MKLFLIIAILLFYNTVFSQFNSRDGIDINPHRPVSLLVIITENSNRYGHREMTQQEKYEWNRLLNHNYTTENAMTGVTKYMYQASFGRFRLFGDFIPYVILLDTKDTLEEGLAAIKAVELANNIDSSTTYNNISYFGSDNGHFFDKWTWTPTRTETPNKKIDFLAIKYTKPGGKSGGRHVNIPSSIPIKENGVDKAFTFNGSESHLIHEFAHWLLGHNDFHTGGAGAGMGTFLSNISGYSLLNSHNYTLSSPNGWDRHRLGWFPQNYDYEISAMSTQFQNRNSDVKRGDFTSRDFILRDFSKYGDVIRIELPYIQSNSGRESDLKKQYIWIENHQLLSGRYENDEKGRHAGTGIRINMQIGKDNINEGYSRYMYSTSTTNYFVPIHPLGNYDFTYDISKVFVDENGNESYWYNAYTSATKENPYTGYHLNMYQATDINGDGNIGADEAVSFYDAYIDGVRFDYVNYYPNSPIPGLGTNRDVFPLNTKISNFTNPPTTPLVTHKTKYRKSNSWLPIDATDNRNIDLNGLSIEIIEIADNTLYSGREIMIRVRWNDYDIINDVRWTGNIINRTYNLRLRPNNTIVLDRGLTPTLSTKHSIPFKGEDVFSEPTVFTCKSGSTMIIDDGAKLIIRNGSKLIMEPNSHIIIRGNGQLIVECDSELEMNDNSTIRLTDKLSSLICHYSSIVTLNNITGLGSHIVFTQNKNLTNKQYNSNELEFGNNITTNNVTVNSGKVIYNARNVTLNNFTVNVGADFEIRTDSYGLNCD
jgi:hypothetical protein